MNNQPPYRYPTPSKSKGKSPPRLFYDCCLDVCQNNSLLLIRPSEQNPLLLETKGYEREFVGWVILDMVTANLVKQVYSQLKSETRERLNALPYSQIIDICMKAISKSR